MRSLQLTGNRIDTVTFEEERSGAASDILSSPHWGGSPCTRFSCKYFPINRFAVSLQRQRDLHPPVSKPSFYFGHLSPWVLGNTAFEAPTCLLSDLPLRSLAIRGGNERNYARDTSKIRGSMNGMMLRILYNNFYLD